MSVTVFTKPSCVACDATKRTLKKKGIVYDEIQLTPEKVEEFKSQGFMSAPIVVREDGHTWAGYKLDEIKKVQEATSEKTLVDTY